MFSNLIARPFLGYNSSIKGKNTMGNNTKQSYDREKDYAKKSLAQLCVIRTQFELAVVNYPNGPKMFNEHLQWVKMKIAERIGKKL